MNNQTIVCCVVAPLLGMLLANMLKNVCGCKLTEGQNSEQTLYSGIARSLLSSKPKAVYSLLHRMDPSLQEGVFNAMVTHSDGDTRQMANMEAIAVLMGRELATAVHDGTLTTEVIDEVREAGRGLLERGGTDPARGRGSVALCSLKRLKFSSRELDGRARGRLARVSRHCSDTAEEEDCVHPCYWMPAAEAAEQTGWNNPSIDTLSDYEDAIDAARIY